MKFQDCIDLVAKRIQGPLPGSVAHERMAPAARDPGTGWYGRETAPMRSGVLLLLYPKNGSPAFLLIERASGGTHGGQIGLPGGKFEPADLTIQQTALRETQEETGVVSRDVRLLGALTSLYIPASGYEVFPQVGYLGKAPSCTPNPVEVKRIIEARLAPFCDPHVRKAGSFETRYGNKEAPYFDYEGERIWGATSMILSEFVELLR